MYANPLPARFDEVSVFKLVIPIFPRPVGAVCNRTGLPQENYRINFLICIKPRQHL